MEQQFTCIWEFEVPVAADDEFQRRYGPNGSWAALFRRDPAYIETLLLKDSSRPGHYLTIDRWQNIHAYHSLRQRFAEEYAALDHICKSLTSSETSLGSFWELAGEPAN